MTERHSYTKKLLPNLTNLLRFKKGKGKKGKIVYCSSVERNINACDKDVVLLLRVWSQHPLYKCEKSDFFTGFFTIRKAARYIIISRYKCDKSILNYCR